MTLSLIRRGVRPGVPKLYKSAFKHQDGRSNILLGAESDSNLSYQITLNNPIENPTLKWQYKTETLMNGNEKLVSRGVRTQNLNPFEGYVALKRVEMQNDSPELMFVDTLKNYRIYCPNTPSLRGLTPDLYTQPPVGLSGGQLADAWQSLIKTTKDEKNKSRLEDALNLIDWISDVDVTTQATTLLSQVVPREKSILRFTDKYMKQERNKLTAYDASEGALYIIFTAILCLHSQAPKIFAIDNFDQALNPRLLSTLVSYLPKWLEIHQRQLLFTAHNPAVLDGLDLTNPNVRLFAVERSNKGVTKIRRIVLSEKIKERAFEYPLSRLWLMGELGAMPNV